MDGEGEDARPATPPEAAEEDAAGPSGRPSLDETVTFAPLPPLPTGAHY